MQNRPIQTEQDYDEALARLARLMGSAPGSPRGDELEVLATLLDAYETKHFPIDAPEVRPGRILTAKPKSRRRIQPK